jgi:hypothetical protein
MPATCPHCSAGRRPEWRSNTREWVHRHVSDPMGGARTFSITLCQDPPAPPSEPASATQRKAA